MTGITASVINKYQGVAPQPVMGAVQQASLRTGVDFAYLMNKAATESSFNPKARAATSSATGLYQFIDSTWLAMVREHGNKYGLSAYADKITAAPNGRLQVADPVVRQEILDLRNNPYIAAMMAGEFASANKKHLESTLPGRKIGSTEMYMAHFMGARGAEKFLKALDRNPQARASALFPKAAQANFNVFFDKDGKANTLQQVYDRFANKFDTDTNKNNGTTNRTSGRTQAPLHTHRAASAPFHPAQTTTTSRVPPLSDVVEQMRMEALLASASGRADNGLNGFLENSDEIRTALSVQKATSLNLLILAQMAETEERNTQSAAQKRHRA